jgi:hypothetical protein
MLAIGMGSHSTWLVTGVADLFASDLAKHYLGCPDGMLKS